MLISDTSKMFSIFLCYQSQNEYELENKMEKYICTTTHDFCFNEAELVVALRDYPPITSQGHHQGTGYTHALHSHSISTSNE